MAAVEFALILPLMLLMYIGINDVTRGVIASRKLNLLSRTVSDLISQQPTSSTVDSSTVSMVFSAATALMEPFDTTGLALTVSAIDVRRKGDKTCCEAVVRWSYTKGGTLRACTTPLVQVANGVAPTPANLPSALITANQSAGYGYSGGSTSYVIIADVTYTYTPIFQVVSWFSAGMRKTSFMVPRSASGAVTLTKPIVPISGQSGVICF